MSIKSNEIVTCPKCGKSSEYVVWNSLNGDLNPEAKQQLLNGTLFVFECPQCGHRTQVCYSILYHDMKHETMVYFVGEDAVESTKEVFSGVESKIDFELPKERKRIVTDQNALREKAVIFENELDDRVIEIIKLFYMYHALKQYPNEHITQAYFLVADGKYIIQFIADKLMTVEFNRELYDEVQQEFAEALSEDDDVCVDSNWARQILEK